METLVQDIRYGIRMLGRNPGFTAVVVLVLAVGIGANTAVFSVVEAVLFRPLPFRAADKLFMVWEADMNRGWGDRVTVTAANFLDWRSQCQAFEGLAAYQSGRCNLTQADRPRRTEVAAVSPSFFQVLGVRSALGRTFASEEERPGNEHVAILDYEFWRSQFGSDPGVIGKQVLVDGVPFVVVGVMPSSFRFPLLTEVDIWRPLVPKIEWGNHTLSVVGRLKPEVTLTQARAEMGAIARRLEEEHPKTNTGWGVTIVPLREQVVGDVRFILLVLFGAIGLVLLVACVNVATMTLARVSGREKEIAVRGAIGASRVRVMRQLLTESILLALVGGGFGFLATVWSLNLLVALCPADMPRLEEIRIDGGVFLFALTVSVLAGVVFGLVPALQLSRSRTIESLKEGGRGSVAGSRRHHVQRILVISEVALALMLLTGAGLMIRSFLSLVRIDPGFKLENLVTCSMSLPPSSYPEEHQRSQFFNALLERIRSVPGVRSAAAVTHLPLGGGPIQHTTFHIEGSPADNDPPSGDRSMVTPGYFQVMGIPVLKGRGFTERDTDGAAQVVVINQAMAERFWGDENPIGRRLTIGSAQSPTWLTIVGIVGNVKHWAMHPEPRAKMYEPYTQDPWSDMHLVMRATADPVSVARGVRAHLAVMDETLPISSITPMKRVLRDSISQPQFNTLLLSVFAATALLLSVAGVYGVTAHSVTQRTHEIGIRVALGARSSDILKTVLRQGFTLVLAGTTLGLVGSLALTRVISSFLYNVDPTDPLTFVCVSLLLVGAALLANYIPARRAARVDPMVALRYE